MRPTVRKLAVAFLAAPFAAACVAAGALPASAGAQGAGGIPFTPCKESNELACAHLTVPLDPSGVTPGTITLAIRRRLAPVGEAHSAVIALAGGPGQSAIPFAETFTELLGPILDTRDLIVFDQRGTGYSHPLACHGFEQPGAYRNGGQLVKACAEQIGPERAFYTSLDSVADIEALRKALGYEKLVLWGTSYGTKVAEEYAQEYPQHVEALVLDSVVPPTGPDPLDRTTFEAIPRILRQLCAYRMCSHITPNPAGDLARLVRRMGGGVISGRYVGPHGHPYPVEISSNELLDILLAGDFDPLLRAEFPAAVRAAAGGDNAPLARLLVHAFGGESEEGEGIDTPLFFTTTCEEEDFPWSRSASPRERLAQARAQIGALPASAFAPFTATNVLDFDELRACAYWPFATPAPPAVTEAMPNVPTLILSGADDLRTPTANARAVAAQIPDAHLLVVPNTGHAVLEDEPTSCARKALQAMFSGGVGVHSIAPCRPGPPTSPLLIPTPLAPARLADVTPTHGYHGRAGRTLQAVALTIADFDRQLTIELLGSSSSANLTSLSSGGLRAGWAKLSKNGLSFHGYSYVSGVTVSGTVKAEKLTLRIGGSAAAHGTLHFGPHKALVGELGGRRVHLGPTDPTATAAIVGSDAQTSTLFALRGVAVRAAAHRLAGLVGWLPGN
ncbi:MAG TPA: alpha/beta fold hydrolase [Solirubrobacteraceae bacterium]|nr:alpha/beta fold hydrolase [Solirubrobacteraceae bacterium]